MSVSPLTRMMRKPAAPSPSKLSVSSVTASAGLQLQASLDLDSNKLNPFSVADDVISQNIIGIHDSQAVRHDVDSLYNVVTNIVQSSTHIRDSLDLKRAKSFELVEDKVPQAGFMPSYSTLKEIACQMTCKAFNTENAHESVVGILEKLRSYTWDAKAVVALTAFALDYGETWRLSLMKASTKENALELHVFRLGDDEKTSNKANVDLISTLVDRTLHLIDGIIQLEKWMADKTYTQKDVPALYKAPRDLYTYWPILALLASATQMTQLELIADKTWRFRVFQTPSGILELLKDLIFHKDCKQLEIYDNTTLKLTKNLLLFISGLDHIEDEIWALKPIHDALTKDKDKQNHKILWVPAVEKWDTEEKEKFEKLKSLMPWYVVQYFSPIMGIKPLQEEWNYQGKLVVVVADTRGEVLNKNAMHMIFAWGIKAFPFGLRDDEKLSLHCYWFWNEAIRINSEIENWVTQEDKYVFFYGGTDIAWSRRFSTLLDTIKKDPIMKQTDTFIEQFNLSKIDPTTESKFWVNITNSFLSKIQKNNSELDSVLKDIQTLLSMKKEKGWALVSKGENVLKLGFNDRIMGVIEGFDDWRKNVVEMQGFDNAFMAYYEYISESVSLPCFHFQLENIRSGVPMTLHCPDESCGMKMEIESVNYKCCHGMHYDHVTTENGEADSATPVLKRMFRS